MSAIHASVSCGLSQVSVTARMSIVLEIIRSVREAVFSRIERMLVVNVYEKDDLNKRSAKYANKSTLVARGANTQLDPSCVSAPPATNVDLFACFAEHLFKSSSISYLPCTRVASDSMNVGMTYVWSIDITACRKWSIDRTAKTTPYWH